MCLPHIDVSLSLPLPPTVKSINIFYKIKKNVLLRFYCENVRKIFVNVANPIHELNTQLKTI